MEIINTIIGLGASVMMPIIFFVVGLIFRMGIGKSFKAGMTVGVGFVGVNMVINLPRLEGDGQPPRPAPDYG